MEVCPVSDGGIHEILWKITSVLPLKCLKNKYTINNYLLAEYQWDIFHSRHVKNENNVDTV